MKTQSRTKLSWFVQYVNTKGTIVFVKKEGAFYAFVTTLEQATPFTNLPAATEFSERVKALSHNPKGVSVVAKQV